MIPFRSDGPPESRFLSNFYATEVRFGEKIFKSAEHLYVFKKFLFFDAAPNPSDFATLSASGIKRLGARIENSASELQRARWKVIKTNVMQDVLREKFRNPELAQLLILTGERMLVEGSASDKFWGSGRTCSQLLAGQNWNGRNELGRALMKIREELTGSMGV